MNSEITFRHDSLILDACCVINLIVYGQVESILRSIPPQVAVAAYVAEKEVQKYDLRKQLRSKATSLYQNG